MIIIATIVFGHIRKPYGVITNKILQQDCFQADRKDDALGHLSSQWLQMVVMHKDLNAYALCQCFDICGILGLND